MINQGIKKIQKKFKFCFHLKRKFRKIHIKVSNFSREKNFLQITKLKELLKVNNKNKSRN